MVSLVKNSTKKGAKIQNEYMFLLRCIMATSWIQNLYFKENVNNVNYVNNVNNVNCINYMKICKEDSVITSLTLFVWWPMKHSGAWSC